MDPISLILAALTAGASAIASGSLGEAGADAYNKIKDSIKKRLVKKKSGEAVLAQYVEDPETWEKPLKKYLTELSIEKDQTILNLAQQVLEHAGDKYDLTFLGPAAIGPDAKSAHMIIEGDVHFHGTRYDGPPPKNPMANQ